MSVQTQIERLNAIKARIRTNLVAQGITVPADTMLDEMAVMILSVAGEDGYTPVKGTDYWTAADQESIVQQVIAALGTPVFGRVDENKHITLSGHLADGTYTISFEDADGFTTEVCTINKVPAPTYTNLFDPSTAVLNTRMSGSSSTSKAQDGYVMTASIPIPSTVIGSSVADSDSYVAVRSKHWAGSANIFYSGDTGRNYADYNATKGTIIGDWVKIPVRGQWANEITATSMVVSLYVSSSAITASDIQDIEIYFDEIPE